MTDPRKAAPGVALGSALALAALACLDGCGDEPCPMPCGEVCCDTGQRCDAEGPEPGCPW